MAVRPANPNSQEVFLTDLGGVNLPVPPLVNQSVVCTANQQLAPYLSQAGAPAPSGTVKAISLGSLAGAGASILSLKGITLAITNNTDQAINDVQIQFSETVGGATITQSYDIPLVANIAASGGTFVGYMPVQAILKNLAVQLTWASAPTTSTASLQAVLHI